jgi:hypothetical protein
METSMTPPLAMCVGKDTDGWFVFIPVYAPSAVAPGLGQPGSTEGEIEEGIIVLASKLATCAEAWAWVDERDPEHLAAVIRHNRIRDAFARYGYGSR